MLGWMISLYRQVDGGSLPATEQSALGPEIAVWQTGMDGLDWLDELVASGAAIHLGGFGYPIRYSLRGKDATPVILNGPPEANETWVIGAHDALDPKWYGKTHFDAAALAECGAEEWLMIEAWDEA